MTNEALLETIKSLLLQQSDSIMQIMDEKLARQGDSFDEKLAQQKDEILAQTTHQMNILLETKVQTQLNLLEEGQKAILDKLVPVTRVETLEEDVQVLKPVVRQVCEDIHELKKAQ